jgi:hypothetical protein
MKCQISVPIRKRLPRSNTDRITILEKRIKQVEGGGGKGRYHNDSNSSNNNNTNEYKQLKEELAYLLNKKLKMTS